MMDAEFEALEGQLRLAQLTADVDVLDRLIADDLLFTGPDGALVTKADDLAPRGRSLVATSAWPARRHDDRCHITDSSRPPRA